MKAELVPENGDPPIPIVKDVTVVGRREFCDVQIDHHSLSKRHCVLVKTDGLLIVRDLATTNGTKVKGQRVRWAALLPDDRIAFGGYKLRVYLGPDDLPGPSELPRQPGKTVRPLSSSSILPPPVGSFPEPTPSPVAMPAVRDLDDLEIVEEDSDDSGWRDLLTGRKADAGDDVVIDLD
jgi:pSer/pThr/pTyr-binding forkhead associated (FHA) protein